MEAIPFARPYIGKEEEDAVLGVLRSGWLTTGKESLEFEKEFGAFFKTGGKIAADASRGDLSPGDDLYCMAVNSATSGLHLALEAVGIEKGDIVLVPSMTFTATAEVVRYLGAELVFVDAVKGGYHMDPAALEATLARLARGLPAYPPRGEKADSSGGRTPPAGADGVSGGNDGEGFGPRGRPRAVIPVHYGGLPCDMNAILKLAEKYGLKVIEDAAHSFPSFDERTGQWAGLMGDAGVFSFYATKTITTGEGGMVVTRDKTIAERVKIMRSHGIDRSVWNRYTDTGASWYYEVVAPGFKYNIPDILSALGRVQLGRATELLAMRKELACRYDEAFADDSRFIIPPSGGADARHLYPLRLNLEALSVSRDVFAGEIQKRGIGISVHFIPLHTMPYYKNRYSLSERDFPETMKTYLATISLPLWPGMDEAQINRVIKVVKDLASGYNGLVR